MASDDFVNSGSTRDFGQEVYQFRTSGAATAIFNGLRAIARRCPQFTFAGTGFGITVTSKVFNAPGPLVPLIRFPDVPGAAWLRALPTQVTYGAN